MAKKRVKQERQEAEPDKLFLINKKLDLILQNQERVTSQEAELDENVSFLEGPETSAAGAPEQEITKLNELENELKKEVKEQHPLTKITYNDITKGSLGAIVGIVLHYTILKGVELAQALDMARAIIIYPISFIIGLVFLYVTGFRKVKQRKVMLFLPVRITVLYTVAIAITVAMLYLLNPAFGQSLSESFKMVAAVSLPAVIGACTADVLGREL